MVIRDGITMATDSGLYLCKEKAVDKAPNGSLIVAVDGDSIPTSTLLSMDSALANTNNPIDSKAVSTGLDGDQVVYSMSYYEHALNATSISPFSIRPASKWMGTLTKFRYIQDGVVYKNWLWKGVVCTALSITTGSSGSVSTLIEMGNFPLPTSYTNFYSNSIFNCVSTGTWVDTNNHGCSVYMEKNNDTGRAMLRCYDGIKAANIEGWVDPIPFILYGSGDEPVWN